MTAIRIIELFGGVGACSMALKSLGLEVDIVDYVEIDKYAVKSFNAINGTSFEPQDVTKWDKDVEDVDIIMHGSPCQDFSVAGLRRGGDEGSGTRSSLMFETVRIVRKVRPKFVLWENVKNAVGKANVHNFYKYVSYLEEIGYTTRWKVMNAKNYGVPQNRGRIFALSVRSDIADSYDFNLFDFPRPFTLEKRLKDVLEKDVDEKYYLSEKLVNGFLAHNEVHKEKGTGFVWKPRDTEGGATCLRANATICPTDNTIECRE